MVSISRNTIVFHRASLCDDEDDNDFSLVFCFILLCCAFVCVCYAKLVQCALHIITMVDRLDELYSFSGGLVLVSHSTQ